MLFSRQNLYKKVHTDENIHEAWRHIRPNSKLAGVDGVNVYVFQNDLLKNLKRLQDELRRKKYSPRPIKRFWVAKPDGTKRPLGILSVRDKIVQRAVYQVIEPIFEDGFEDCSYAFRRGRSVETAIANVNYLVNQGNYWAVHVDIKHFFDYVDVKLLYTFITEKIKDSDVRRLMKVWLDEEASVFGKKWFFTNSKLKGILQGGILSPLYANVYLDRFDKQAIENGLKIVRFADNIIALTPRKSDAKIALKKIRWILKRLHLQLNEKKTRLTHLENKITFLGKKLVLMKSGKKAWLDVRDPQANRSNQRLIQLQETGFDQNDAGRQTNFIR
ncbi:MAG: hypothetical protein E3K32_03430 [wastewater metagenome]|nr:hypothetical protein [Candidatus Loosdrechtia aerotolerans]